jgi:2-keto-4-pentenoate hydratase/2-oxohepta-3-ene-1,7-dioic acid hydratase in catechol pathway
LSVDEQISKLFEVKESFAGDIIFSGITENLGSVVKDDLFVCKIDHLMDLLVKII